MSNDKIGCSSCEKQELTKDEIAVCKKLLGRQTIKFFCLPCLAEFMGCTEEDILAKIEMFKMQGCRLFG